MGSVRYGLGRAGRFGRSRENSSPVFGLLAPNRALRCVENPRVDGSIPSLATTFNFLNGMRFRVSPADYRASFWPEKRLTIGLSEIGWVAPAPFTRRQAAVPDIATPAITWSADGAHLDPANALHTRRHERSQPAADLIHRTLGSEP